MTFTVYDAQGLPDFEFFGRHLHSHSVTFESLNRRSETATGTKNNKYESENRVARVKCEPRCHGVHAIVEARECLASASQILISGELVKCFDKGGRRPILEPFDFAMKPVLTT